MDLQASSLEEFCTEFVFLLQQRGDWDAKTIAEFMQAEAVMEQLRIHAGKLVKLHRLHTFEEWLNRLWQEVHRRIRYIPTDSGTRLPNYFRKLCKSARGAVYGKAKKELSEPHHEGKTLPRVANAVEMQIEQSDLMDCVRLQMATLPLQVQNLIKAHIMCDMKQVEIAALIGKKRSQVSDLIKHVRTHYLPRLKRLIDENCLGVQA